MTAQEETEVQRAERVKKEITFRLAQHVTQARADEHQELRRQLGEALGVDPEVFSWPELIGMVLGVRAVADLVLVDAASYRSADPEKRLEMLTAFGFATEWAQVQESADAAAPSLREALGLSVPERTDDDNRSGS